MTQSSYYASLGGFSEQTPKGDDWWHAGTIQEEEGGQTLQAERIPVVAPVPGGFAFDVQHQAPKQPVETRQSAVPLHKSV